MGVPSILREVVPTLGVVGSMPWEATVHPLAIWGVSMSLMALLASVSGSPYQPSLPRALTSASIARGVGLNRIPHGARP